MTKTRFIAIFTASLCLFANTLLAKPRTCRLIYPERPQDAPKVAFLFDGTKSYSITLPSMNLSEVVELPKGELTLVMTNTSINNPELLPPRAPLLRIPEEVTDFYIIVIPDSENQVIPVKMNLVDTGAGKLKPGETLWYNLTDHRIVAKLGTADMAVKPKEKTITRNPIPESGYYVARFAYQANGKGALAPITEQSWWHDSKSRHLGFIANTGGKLPKIYFFRDFRMEAEEDQEGGEEVETPLN